MFERIVQREDGIYAIKRWSLLCGWEYLDKHGLNYWWPKDIAERHSWTTDLDQLNAIFDKLINASSPSETVIRKK